VLDLKLFSILLVETLVVSDFSYQLSDYVTVFFPDLLAGSIGVFHNIVQQCRDYHVDVFDFADAGENRCYFDAVTNVWSLCPSFPPLILMYARRELRSIEDRNRI
jgi:hypothetical protein